MDRQGHDFAAAAIAYAQQPRQPANMKPQQQQQQFGFHPPHQQFPSSVHVPPFLPPHPSMQQFPYHPHMQQQVHPHGPPHSHLLHLQQQQQGPPSFPSHYPPNLVSSFHWPYDSPPLPAPPPSDPELHKRIDKTVEYAAKNGPEFEAMIREKQKDNPSYDFLFGGEGHNYYCYKIWVATHPSRPFNSPFPTSSMPGMHPPPNPIISPSPLNGPPLNTAVVGSSVPVLATPQINQSPYPLFYEQHHHHQLTPFGLHGRTDYDQSVKPPQGLSGPLPSDVALELSNIVNNLNGTKESIKGAKIWFMKRSSFASALVEALRDRVHALDDVERQLHILYLANDILFDSLNRRVINHELDNEAFAFKPILGSMLARIYHNPQSNDEYRKRLQQMVEFWAAKDIYDQETISVLNGEMIGGLHYLSTIRKDVSAGSTDPAAGLSQLASHQWLSDMPIVKDKDHPDKHAVSGDTIQPPSAFATPISVLPSQTTASSGEKLPPYPLFPPGLIPGMVRKMQIGSGVPYSPLSPLDTPTVIPPSSVSQSEILQSVSKFFKEIDEVNPSEGPIFSSSKDDDDAYDRNYDREPLVRKGGACIPPPPNLQVDPETVCSADGSVDQKPGSNGRLGLGAAASPCEASQYDDVYSSYRKERSTNYHSSMSARASAR